MTKDNQKLINQDRDLDELFQIASHEELSAIADIITDSGRGRLSLSEDVKRDIIDHQSKRSLSKIATLLSREIRAFGSNTLASVARGGKPVEYQEVALDVAKKLGVKDLPKDASCVNIEFSILVAILTKSLKDKTPEEISKMLKESGCEFDNSVQAVIKSTTNLEMLIRSLTTSSNALSLAKMISGALTPSLATGGAVYLSTGFVARAPAMFNPLGMALAAVWAGYDMSGPAYRVTIPAIAHIAFIRQTQINFEIERSRMELRQCL